MTLLSTCAYLILKPMNSYIHAVRDNHTLATRGGVLRRAAPNTTVSLGHRRRRLSK